jgi:hypothetical protein
MTWAIVHDAPMLEMQPFGCLSAYAAGRLHVNLYDEESSR